MALRNYYPRKPKLDEDFEEYPERILPADRPEWSKEKVGFAQESGRFFPQTENLPPGPRPEYEMIDGRFVPKKVVLCRLEMKV